MGDAQPGDKPSGKWLQTQRSGRDWQCHQPDWLQEDLEDQQMCLQMQNVTQPEAQDAKCG